MCGIFGFINSKYSFQEKLNILKNMGDRIRHRGPDDDGYLVNNNIALGIRRLSIIDLKTGKQPIYSNDKNLVIVYNGEIYNFLEIRSELENKGYKFHTDTDTEVVVNMFQDRGPECLNKLNGMFVFVIYNINKDELFIARDRFGIKPLYYTYRNRTLVFGSELKSLLEFPKINTDISLEALDLYLTFEYVPAPYTIYKNINKLEQGHYLNYKNGKLKKEKWYQLTYQPKFKSKRVNDYLDELDELINDAVKIRTISDVPLGAFLSGGIDSSLISYYLAKNSNKKVQTFCIGFDEKSFDESTYSRQIADFLDTDHHEKLFNVDEMLGIMPKIIETMDEPFADASFLPTYLLSQFTKEKVTVVLSGDGGDEVFAGYPTYLARKMVNYIPAWSYPFLKTCANLLPVSDSNISFDFKAKKLTEALNYKPDVMHQYWLGSFNEEQKKKLYKHDAYYYLKDKNIVGNIIGNYMPDCDTENNWERSLWLDMRFYLQDNMLVKVDRASMVSSLEVRVPFLDHRIVEFTNRIPAKLKYKGVTSKYLLKKLAKNYLPDNIVNRPKKGFGIPVARWIKKEMKNEFSSVFLDNNSALYDYFNDYKLKELLEQHLENKKDNRKLLWTLFIFNKWHSRL